MLLWLKGTDGTDALVQVRETLNPGVVYVYVYIYIHIYILNHFIIGENKFSVIFSYNFLPFLS